MFAFLISSSPVRQLFVERTAFEGSVLIVLFIAVLQLCILVFPGSGQSAPLLVARCYLGLDIILYSKPYCPEPTLQSCFMSILLFSVGQ